MTDPHAPQSSDPAAARHAILTLLRFASVGAVMLGIAIAYGAVEAPMPLGFVLAFGGLGMFFFGVRRIARRWKSEDIAPLPDDTKNP